MIYFLFSYIIQINNLLLPENSDSFVRLALKTNICKKGNLLLVNCSLSVEQALSLSISVKALQKNEFSC
jgi:hypothetical protein